VRRDRKNELSLATDREAEVHCIVLESRMLMVVEPKPFPPPLTYTLPDIHQRTSRNRRRERRRKKIGGQNLKGIKGIGPRNTEIATLDLLTGMVVEEMMQFLCWHNEPV
jgi:hypothetical protein